MVCFVQWNFADCVCDMVVFFMTNWHSYDHSDQTAVEHYAISVYICP